jgi:membrane protein YdbS with pleckstrin-like domain
MSKIPTNPPPAKPQPTVPGPHSEPDNQEEVYFDGSPPLRGILGQTLIFDLIFIILLASGIMLLKQHMDPGWIGLVLILISLSMPGIPLLKTRSIRYRVTNYRIDFERGFFGKSIDTMELWHVEDLHFHQSLMDRILGVGTITVISHDDTMPQLELHGIPNPRPLYETLKQRVIAVKRQRGVIKMDPG